MKIVVRQSDDLELIHELDREAMPLDSAIDEDELAHSVWWVARLDGRPVGYAGLTVQDGGARAYLCRAAVLKEARGSGLQRRLLRARLSYARRLGCPRVWTYVWAYNIASLRNCVRAGMVPYFVDKPETHTWIYLEKVFDVRPKLEVPSDHAIRTSNPVAD